MGFSCSLEESVLGMGERLCGSTTVAADLKESKRLSAIVICFLHSSAQCYQHLRTTAR